MKESQQAEHLGSELDKLIQRFMDEYDMVAATAIGVLMMKIHVMIQCCADNANEEE